MNYFPPESGPLSDATRPIAVLRQEPKQLARRASVAFSLGFDDLDQLQWAELAGRAGRRYALVRHRHAPQPGTHIVISPASTDPRRDLLDVLRALNLEEDDLSWSHPDVRRKRGLARKPAGSASEPRPKRVASRRPAAPLRRPVPSRSATRVTSPKK